MAGRNISPGDSSNQLGRETNPWLRLFVAQYGAILNKIASAQSELEAFDALNGQNIKWQLTGDLILGNTSIVLPLGVPATIILQQASAGGPWSVAFGSDIDLQGESPVISTTADSYLFLFFIGSTSAAGVEGAGMSLINWFTKE